LITCAKGLSSAYASIGAVVAAEHVAEPFVSGAASFTHGVTFGGHPVQAAIALANLEVMRRERVVEGVLEREQAFRDTLAPLLELPIIGDVRGGGFFWAVELVKDKDTRQGFTAPEREELLRGFLGPRMLERGLIARADDRGDPVIQLSPPLIAGQEEFDRIAAILGDVLSEAQERVQRMSPPSS
jgi:adenosylmethionine-8-amino-7-oxononanoate aminotransferase